MRFSHLLLAAAPLAALLAGCATTQPAATAAVAAVRLPGRYLATPPVIDGRDDDWTDSLHYDPASRLRYQVLNDGRTVYVRLKASDTQSQAKIVYLGMVVWLDSTGRGSQQLGVRFPLAPDMSQLRDDSHRPEGAPPPSASEREAMHVARMKSLLLNAREMELLNFRGSKEPVLTDSESKLGVKAAGGVNDHNDFIYELAVPLRLLYRRPPALAAGSPPAVVGVYVASQRPKAAPGSGGSQYDASNNGGGMGGMGGGYGGRMGGGYGGRMGGGMRSAGGGSTFVTLTFKTATQLAPPK